MYPEESPFHLRGIHSNTFVDPREDLSASTLSIFRGVTARRVYEEGDEWKRVVIGKREKGKEKREQNSNAAIKREKRRRVDVVTGGERRK